MLQSGHIDWCDAEGREGGGRGLLNTNNIVSALTDGAQATGCGVWALCVHMWHGGEGVGVVVRECHTG